MPVNKVVFGENVLIDLTADTVSPDKLKKGVTAHDRSGTEITGTMDDSSVVVVDGDEIECVLLHAFREGDRLFAEDGTVTATDQQGRILTRTFTDDGKTCTSVLVDADGEELSGW